MASQTVATEVVSSLIKKGIKILALDFDKTIIDIHTAGFWKQGTVKLVEHVRPCFKALMESALARYPEICVCIVTYSMQPTLIRDVLKNALSRDVDHIIIRANNKDWIPTSGLSSTNACLGKQNHIAWICTQIYDKRRIIIEPQEILLMDDDPDNVNIARDFGHSAFEVHDDVSLEIVNSFVDELVVNKKPAIE